MSIWQNAQGYFKAAPATLALILAACGGGGGGGGTTPSPTPVVTDSTPPVISITGDESVTVPFASVFVDEGATANDNVDGGLNVQTEGNVDTFTAGTYTITYSATDSAGNSASATRTVIVEKRRYTLAISSFGKVNFSSSDDTQIECNSMGDVCAGSFVEGETITITAAAQSGWNFEYWRSCDSIDGTSCTVTVDRDRTLLSTATRNTPLVYASNVVFLAADQMSSVVNFDPSFDTLIFEEGANLSGVEIGNIVIADGTVDGEVAFARRVVEVLVLPGAPTLVKTVNSTLDDIIEEGTLLIRPEDFAASSAATPTKTSTVVRPSEKIIGSIDFSESLGGGLVFRDPTRPTGTDGNNVSVLLKGGVEGTATLEFAWDEEAGDGSKTSRFSVGLEMTPKLSIEVKGEIDQFILKEKQSFAKIPVGSALVGPIKVDGIVEIFGTLDAGLETKVEPSVQLTGAGILGFQYNSETGLANLSRLSVDEPEILGFSDTLEATVFFEPGLAARTSVELWNLAGPFAEAGVHLGGRFVVKGVEDQCTSTEAYLGSDVEIGGKIEVLTWEVEAKFPVVQSERVFFKRDSCDVTPAPPANLVVTAESADALRLVWDVATDSEDVVSYEIWRRDPGLSSFLPVRRIAEPRSSSFLDGDLQPETEYCYYVIAVSAADRKSEVPLNLVCATTLSEIDTIPPTTPGSPIAAALSTTAIELTWSNATDSDGIDTYFIRDVTGGAGQSYTIGNASGQSFTITRLKPNTEYCYDITAVDNRGLQSAPSATICATTFSPENAEWSVFLGCQGREFLLEAKLDFDETINEFVEVSGEGNDYDGDPLTYSLRGQYTAGNGDLAADIFWLFPGTASVRQDRFQLNLASGDSGIVFMEQVQVTGCDAQVQITKSGSNSAASAGAMKPGTQQRNLALLMHE